MVPSFSLSDRRVLDLRAVTYLGIFAHRKPIERIWNPYLRQDVNHKAISIHRVSIIGIHTRCV